MPNTFKDKQGREYTVVIDGYVLSRARTHGRLSLSDILPQRGPDGIMQAPKVDPAFMIELCFYGCEHCARIASGKVSKEEFLRSLTGKVMQDAIEATTDALMTCLAPPEADLVHELVSAEVRGEAPLAL